MRKSKIPIRCLPLVTAMRLGWNIKQITLETKTIWDFKLRTYRKGEGNANDSVRGFDNTEFSLDQVKSFKI